MKRSDIRYGILVASLLFAACGSPMNSQLGSPSGGKPWNPVHDEPHGQATRYPILIANGIIAPSKQLQPVIDALKNDGHRVFITTPPEVHPIQARAETVAKAIDEVLAETGEPKVNVIAYSAGGLDARSVISSWGYADRVASLTMLAVPNQGSALADAVLDGLNWIPSFMRPLLNGLSITVLHAQNPDLKEAQVYPLIYDLSTGGARVFNQKNPDSPAVYYQTYGTLSFVSASRRHFSQWLQTDCEGKYFGSEESLDQMNGDLAQGLQLLKLRPWRFPRIMDKASDGVVAMESQKLGRFRGCIPSDHYDVINSLRGPKRDLGFEDDDPITGFNPIRFYRNISFDLERLGF